MKSAGELLQEKRQLLELSLDEVETKLKVKASYLQALENSDFNALPSAPVTKGFLKSYARLLHLNPDTLIAMYRRDYDEIMGEILPHGLIDPVLQKKRFLSVTTLLVSLALITFGGFLLYQLINWWSLPALTITQPINEETYGEQITVKGKTDPDATIRVGEQLVPVSQEGQFSLDLKFPAGTHRLIIQASDREGRTRLQERTFTVSK